VRKRSTKDRAEKGTGRSSKSTASNSQEIERAAESPAIDTSAGTDVPQASAGSEPHEDLPRVQATSAEGLEHVIRERAYRLWEDAGRPGGRDQEFWWQAREQLLREGAIDAEKG